MHLPFKRHHMTLPHNMMSHDIIIIIIIVMTSLTASPLPPTCMLRSCTHDHESS